MLLKKSEFFLKVSGMFDGLVGNKVTTLILYSRPLMLLVVVSAVLVCSRRNSSWKAWEGVRLYCQRTIFTEAMQKSLSVVLVVPYHLS